MPSVEQFNRIYLKHYKKAFRFAMLYVRNDLVAEDIATEALIKLWETMKRETVEAPLALLLTILKHKSLDFLKRHTHEQEALEAMAEWQQRELAIRISTLEACDPEYILSDEVRTIMTHTLDTLPSEGEEVGDYVRFKPLGNASLLMKVALSYVSEDQARLNLKTELNHWDFDRVVADAHSEWNLKIFRTLFR